MTAVSTDFLIMERDINILGILAGFALFLALIIDRMHHYIRELRVLRKGVEAERKRSKEKGESGEEVARLKAKIADLEARLAAADSRS